MTNSLLLKASESYAPMRVFLPGKKRAKPCLVVPRLTPGALRSCRLRLVFGSSVLREREGWSLGRWWVSLVDTGGGHRKEFYIWLVVTGPFFPWIMTLVQNSGS